MNAVREHSLVTLNWFDRLLTARRVRLFALCCLSCGLAFQVWLVVAGHFPFEISGSPVGADFIAKAAGGRMALDGQWHRLYDPHAQFAVERELLGHSWSLWDSFIAPPIAAYLFAPFAAVPYLVGVALWTAFSVLLIAASEWLLWPCVPVLHQFGRGFLLLVIFASFPTVQLLILGQDAAVCLFLLTMGLRLLLARRDMVAGSVLALGVFKPQYFLLVPLLLLLQRRWRALAAWAGVAGALTLLSVALIGGDGVRAYLHLLTGEFNHNGVGGGRAWGVPSLFGLARLMRAFLPSTVGNIATAAMLGAGALLLIRWLDKARNVARTGRELELLYGSMILITVLTNPDMFYFDAVILLVPALVLYELAGDALAVRVLLAAVYLLSWSYVPLAQPVFAQPLTTRFPGPLPLLSAPWVVLPLIGLFEITCRRLRVQDRSAGGPANAHPALL